MHAFIVSHATSFNLIGSNQHGNSINIFGWTKTHAMLQFLHAKLLFSCTNKSRDYSLMEFSHIHVTRNLGLLIGFVTISYFKI